MGTHVVVMIFLPVFMAVMAMVSMMTGLKRRARLKRERAQRDQQRFLGMGFLRKGWR